MKKSKAKKVKRSSGSGAKVVSTAVKRKAVKGCKRRPKSGKYTAKAISATEVNFYVASEKIKKGKVVPAHPVLKPCAHCASEATYVGTTSMMDTKFITVRCTNTMDCLMRTCNWSTHQGAADAWNRRAG